MSLLRSLFHGLNLKILWLALHLYIGTPVGCTGVCAAGLDTSNLYMEVYQKYSGFHAESLAGLFTIQTDNSVYRKPNISLDDALFLCTSSDLPNPPAPGEEHSFLSSAIPTHVEPPRIQTHVLRSRPSLPGLPSPSGCLQTLIPAGIRARCLPKLQPVNVPPSPLSLPARITPQAGLTPPE